MDTQLLGMQILFLDRKGKTENEPTNIPYILLGTGLLWFGWFGFNAGSALAADGVATTAFVNTNIASATAMLTWLLGDGALGKKRSAVGAAVGAVVGLLLLLRRQVLLQLVKVFLSVSWLPR